MKCRKVQGDTGATNLVRNPEYIVGKLLGNKTTEGRRYFLSRSCLASLKTSVRDCIKPHAFSTLHSALPETYIRLRRKLIKRICLSWENNYGNFSAVALLYVNTKSSTNIECIIIFKCVTKRRILYMKVLSTKVANKNQQFYLQLSGSLECKLHVFWVLKSSYVPYMKFLCVWQYPLP